MGAVNLLNNQSGKGSCLHFFKKGNLSPKHERALTSFVIPAGVKPLVCFPPVM